MSSLNKIIKKIEIFSNQSPAEGCEISYIGTASKLFELFLKANTIAEENKEDANSKLQEIAKIVDSLVDEEKE